jgi:hypothetical protein
MALVVVCLSKKDLKLSTSTSHLQIFQLERTACSFTLSRAR